ncbi:MAG: NfeD family protein [Arenimonas sp.]|nr:NfeD family protein [Arenimonas sp.]
MNGAGLFWAALALVLIGLETMAPGILLLWLGFAAAGVFLLLVLGLKLSILTQTLAFVALSFISVGLYFRFFRKSSESSDQPLLNRKQEQMVGKQINLETAIVNGEGRVKIGDAFWQVQGPDLPEGALVRVVSVDSAVLRVLPAE